MSELRVQIVGDEKVNAYLKRCAQRFPGLVRQRLTLGVSLLERAAHKNIEALFRRRSGKLQRMTQRDGPYGSGENMWARVISGAKYAPYLEEGTGPHVIEPRTAKALHFTWRGEERFFKRVNHPGMPGRPFMRPALEKNRSELIRIFSEGIAKDLERV